MTIETQLDDAHLANATLREKWRQTIVERDELQLKINLLGGDGRYSRSRVESLEVHIYDRDCTIIKLREEIEQLKSQLPEGMERCTIIFKECEKGHGTLTAANWVDVPCRKCQIDELQTKLEAIEGLVEELTDEDPCQYDHHGYCQAHSLHPRPCPHERAKAIRAIPDSKDERTYDCRGLYDQYGQLELENPSASTIEEIADALRKSHPSHQFRVVERLDGVEALDIFANGKKTLLEFLEDDTKCACLMTNYCADEDGICDHVETGDFQKCERYKAMKAETIDPE